jgi:probable O-glycosylation ligase (exosortase A-associated)
MRDVLLTVLIFGAIPVVLARPHIGILMFAWFGYMNPHRFTWGFAYTMPFAAMIGAATIVGFMFTKDRNRIPFTALTFIWFAWILWMNVTTLFALSSEWVYDEWDRAMKIQLMTILALALMQSRRKVDLLVWVIAISVGIFGIKGGIFTAMTGGNFLVWGPPGSFFEGNNGLAIALLMVMPLFLYLRTTTENKWLRRALLASVLMCALSVLGSYSRGALLAICAVCVYMVWKSPHRWRILPFMVLAGFIALSLMPGKWFDRIETIQTYEEDRSAMGRINAWQFAFNLAKDRPLVGGGYGAFSPDLFLEYAPIPDNFHDAHSIYFEALGEHGFVGLILFLALGWTALGQANAIRRATRHRPDQKWAYDLISMVQLSLIGYAVGGLFLGLAYFDLYYHMIALIVITRRLTETERLSQPQQAGDVVAST